MKKIKPSLLALAIFGLGLSACSSSQEETKANLEGQESLAGERVALFQATSPSNSASAQAGLKPSARPTPRSNASDSIDPSDDLEGVDEMSSEDSDKKSKKEPKEDLKALLELEKTKIEAVEAAAQRKQMDDIMKSGQQNRQTMMMGTLFMTMMAARFGQNAIESTKPKSEAESMDPHCQPSAVGSATDDLMDVMSAMAAYGMVAPAVNP
jgi:hypothetical protein